MIYYLKLSNSVRDTLTKQNLQSDRSEGSKHELPQLIFKSGQKSIIKTCFKTWLTVSVDVK